MISAFLNLVKEGRNLHPFLFCIASSGGTSTSLCLRVNILLWLTILYSPTKIGCYCAKLLQDLQGIISDSMQFSH